MTMIVKLLKHQFKFDSVYTPIFGDESDITVHCSTVDITVHCSTVDITQHKFSMVIRNTLNYFSFLYIIITRKLWIGSRDYKY